MADNSFMLQKKDGKKISTSIASQTGGMVKRILTAMLSGNLFNTDESDLPALDALNTVSVLSGSWVHGEITYKVTAEIPGKVLTDYAHIGMATPPVTVTGKKVSSVSSKSKPLF
jgi:hypothetical protein